MGQTMIITAEKALAFHDLLPSTISLAPIPGNINPPRP